MNAVEAFKARALTGPQSSPETILDMLSSKPSEITVIGSGLATAVLEARKMGAFIPSMMADRATYKLGLSWPDISTVPVALKAHTPDAGMVESLPEQPPTSHSVSDGRAKERSAPLLPAIPDQDPIASALESIRAGAERNRRNAALERRFKRP